MASQKSAKKPATTAPGMKMLIAAASVAATLGGWALISSNEKPPAVTESPAPIAAAVEDKVIKINLEPLPTLVPVITPQSQVVAVNRPRAAASAVQSAPAPQPAPATELVLRDVSAPALSTGRSSSAPAPVTSTKSSR